MQSDYVDQIAADLRSDDPGTRYRALHRVCPCGRIGWSGFEAHRGVIDRLRKDTEPKVRAAALHVLQDACELESGSQPTTPRVYTNEMAAAKRRNRWRRDYEDPEPRSDDRRSFGLRGQKRGRALARRK